MDEITHPELKRMLFELLGQQALLHQEEGALVTVEDVEEDDHLATPVLNMASDSVATSEPVVHEEEGTETDLSHKVFIILIF